MTPTPQTALAEMLAAVLESLREVRKGDFSVRLPERRGLVGQVAAAANEVVASNQRFECELAALSRMVGREGRLDHRVDVGHDSAWADAAESVNDLVDHVVWTIDEMTRVVGAVSEGDLSCTIPLEVDGRPLEGQFMALATTINALVHQFSVLSTRVAGLADGAATLGTDSCDGGERGANGVWTDLSDDVDRMVGTLSERDHDISALTTAVADGDRSMQIAAGEQKAHVTALRYQGFHDALTGLPNRALFNDRLRQCLLVAARDTEPLGLLMVDVDDFKQVNDALGHEQADVLLVAIARRLTATLREPDTVARVGGDEFAILPAGRTDLDGAVAMAWKVLQALEPAFDIGGRSVDVRVSVGISLFPQHGSSPQGLLRRADQALREAKRSKTGFAVFAAAQEAGTAGRLALVGDLRHCLARDQLVLHYQPKVDLTTRRTVGVEALVRWQRPSGLVAPDMFVSLIERIGMIVPMTRWVLGEALHQLRLWRDLGLDLNMAVNLSTRSLEGLDIAETVAELTDTWGVPADRLTLEITEGALINVAAPAVCERLHQMGERLSIDDFGTGYSSLGYLHRLPIDEVKIDKSFVTDVTSVDDNATIVRSTIDLGHNLGMKVCAEGVEDVATVQMLIDWGCDMAQGYTISRPLAAPQLQTWLTQSPWPTHVLNRPDTVLQSSPIRDTSANVLGSIYQ